MQGKLSSAVLDALRFEETMLPNGLAVRLIAMPEYGSVHAIYSTNFGSVNRVFEQNEKRTQLPAGVAHFLEHKMFEDENGQDAFSLYAKTGASANAYTGFERTSYIFTATNEIDRNLDILLSFVGHPYFTKETIEKEQGIIGQEIKMYDDHAEMRCFYALLECMFHNHPVKDDIAGSVESITAITPEMLYTCCEAFYTPANMVLCAAGDITMQQLLQAVQRAGLPQQKAAEVTRIWPREPAAVVQKEKRFEMPVSMPLFALGFKEKPAEGDTLKTEVVCDMITELIAGETSMLYRRLYDEGLVQGSFGGEYGKLDGCLYYMFSGESDEPDKVRQALLNEVKRQRDEGVDLAQFETCKKMMYGEAIADLENVERVASMLSGSYFRKRTPAQELAAVAALTPQDVQDALASMLQEENSAFVVVTPSKN